MRIGLLTPEWYPDEGSGGIATYCRTFARAARDAGHHVAVFAATVRPRRTRQVDGRLAVFPVPVAGLRADRMAELFAARLRSYLYSGGRIDVVEAAEYGGVAAYLVDEMPVVTRLHTPLAILLDRNDGQRIYRDDAARCELEEQQARGSAHLTSPSRWLADEVHRLWRLTEPPAVIPNPVAVPAIARPALGRGPVRVLYAGRLEHRKGVLPLAAAAREWFDGGVTAEIAFVGGDTRWCGRSMAEQMGEILGPYAGTARCRFLPPRPPAAVGALVDRAHLVVLPSLYENFPYTCLEAMARGRPVLATTGSGFEEILTHGRDGFLVPPGDSDALARALAVSTVDLRRLASAGQAARRTVARFDAGTVTARLCAAYARCGLAPAPAGKG